MTGGDLAPSIISWTAIEIRQALDAILEGLAGNGEGPLPLLAWGFWEPVTYGAFSWQETPSPSIPLSGDTALIIEAASAKASEDGLSLACIVYLRKATHPLRTDQSLVLPAPPVDVSEAVARAIVGRGGKGITTVFVAAPETLQSLGMAETTPLGQQLHGAGCSADAAAETLRRVARTLDREQLCFTVAFTALPEIGKLRWVREERKTPSTPQVQKAPALLHDLPSLDQATGLETDPRGALREAKDLWEPARSFIKERLEAVIASLSTLEYPTFEEKRQIVDEISDVLSRWGFVPVAPATGLPSYLRTMKNLSNPLGYFYFKSVRGTTAVAQPDPTAKRTPVALPAFRLTDAPPGPKYRTTDDREA